MAKDLRYVSATGAVVELDGPVTWSQGALDARGREWEYALGYRDAYNLTRPARAVTLEVWTNPAEADNMRRVFDADVANSTPGELIAENVWHQRALVTASQARSAFAGNIGLQLTVLLLDGAWWAVKAIEFAPDDGSEAYEFLDYPYDYDYDYSRASSSKTVDTGLLVASPVRIIIYGPATNPYVVAGGNRYQVDVNVPSGGYLVIDGRAKTIELVAQNGTATDVFAAGVRGSGEGGGSYIFENVAPGEQPVSWDGSFGFDFGWYDEEGEPPWSRS